MQTITECEKCSKEQISDTIIKIYETKKIKINNKNKNIQSMLGIKIKKY